MPEMNKGDSVDMAVTEEQVDRMPKKQVKRESKVEKSGVDVVRKELMAGWMEGCGKERCK